MKRFQFVISCFGLLALAACKDPSFFQALGEKIATDTLAISPTAVTVPVNGTVTFSASGGAAPYTFAVLPARSGAINPSTGDYTAPTIQSTETVRVTDHKGRTADAAVTIAGNTGALTIQPSTVSINVGGSITFVATGGSGTYTYAMQTAASGPPVPTVGVGTGVYAAGNSGSTTDVVRVSDGVTFKDATITVTTTNSPVNYDISAATLPAAGTGGSVLGGGYSFTIHNGGTGAGAVPISWWVFMSPAPVPGSGSTLLASGSYAGPAIAPVGTANVPLSWTWPSVLPPGGTRYLYIMISAADDLVPANNTYTSGALTLSPANVHYTVAGVTNTGGIAAGGALTGQFDITNAGTGAGTYTGNWRAYLSADGSQWIDAGATLIASGSFSPLNGGASTATPVSFSGTWPAAHGTYFLKVQVSAPDEVSPDPLLPAAPPWPNTGVTAAPEDTTYVENGVQSVTAAPAGVAGSPIAATFTILNSGLAAGSQIIAWQAYVSTNTTLDGGDTFVSSGSRAGIAVGAPTGVTVTGNWPAGTTGTRYLIVHISSLDDTSLANNFNVSTAVTVTAPDVKYQVPPGGVTNTPPSIAGGTINGSFTLNNFGTAAGTQTVFWTAYVSTDPTNTIDGSAKVVDSGTHAAVAAGGSPVQSFAGTWPATPGTYYLKVLITAADDLSAGDDIMASAAVVTTVPDYDVSAVANTGPAMAGRALSGTFTLHNGGSANGTKTVSWTVFVSTNAVLDAGDTAVAAGTTGFLNAGVSQAGIPFTGTWPSSVGSFFLIVKVTASDDMNPANDVGASGAVAVVAPDVNYSVTAVNNTGPLVSAGPLAGNFTLHNGGTVTGIQTVHWTVYASPGNAVIDGADTVVASGSVLALGPGATQAGIGFNGTWPAAFGPYSLIVLITAGDDQPPGGKTGASAALTVTRVDYAVTAVNWVSGTAAGAPFAMNFTVRNNGDANGTQNLYWSVYASPNNSTLDAGDTLIASSFIAGGLGAATQQVVPVGGTWPFAVGNYFLVVSASAADESTGLIADNVNHNAAAVAVVAANVDYTVTAVGAPGGYTIPTGLVTGFFTYKNVGVNNGALSMPYAVYASTDAVLDATDTIVATGTVPPLNAGVTSGGIPFSGAWPLAYGTYYLIVQVNALDDINGLNNRMADAAPTPVGIFAESEPNNDCINFVDANDLLNTGVTGVMMRPGMSLKITGSMANSDSDDVFKITTAPAGPNQLSSITTSWTVASTNKDMGIFYYAPSPATILYGFSVAGSPGTNSLSMTWNLTGTDNGAVRYIDLFNAGAKNMGTWTCIINGN